MFLKRLVSNLCYLLYMAVSSIVGALTIGVLLLGAYTRAPDFREIPVLCIMCYACISSRYFVLVSGSTLKGWRCELSLLRVVGP